ncbi:hypothetical protein MMC14_001663 [Varicellaria rhodocarpa]|nr:hypothetical protein [Varicellaria rhodocarpa]
MGFGEEIREEFSGNRDQNQGYDQQQQQGGYGGGYDQQQQGGYDQQQQGGYDQQQQGGYDQQQQGGYGGDQQQQGQSWEKKAESSGENAIIDQGINDVREKMDGDQQLSQMDQMEDNAAGAFLQKEF